MTKGRVSVIIPSRRERFLAHTIADLLAQARGDVEVIAVLDGYWPDPPLVADPRLVVLHKDADLGMRNGINDAARIATGEYLLKIDGHCAVAEGYDVALRADCESDWLVVPRRYSLDADLVCIVCKRRAFEGPLEQACCGAPMTQHWARKLDRPVVDAHYLSYPFARPGDRTCGLHGNVWMERAAARASHLVDDEMSSQGSCWFTSRAWWDRCLGEMEVARYGTFAQEFQEIGMKTWLAGGRVVVNRTIWYSHLHKGKEFGTGYGFSNARWKSWAEEKERARRFTIDWWLFDRWAERRRDVSWLIDRFWPVPGWPVSAMGSCDWDAVYRAAEAQGFRRAA